MNWLNPLWWWAAGKAAFQMTVSNPLGAGFIYVVSGLQTFWTTGFLTSLAYPNWARDLYHEVLPVVKQFTAASVDVFLTFWNTS